MPPTRVLTRRALRLSPRAINPKIGIPSTPSRRSTSQTPSSSSSSPPTTSPPPSFHQVFTTPTWSVRTLLSPSSPSSPSSSTPSPPIITPTTLHHLLRLSALPPPRNPTEEAALLQTLHTQLHFVRAIQAVDTTGVAPLTSIRDETSSAAVVTLDKLRDALAAETVVGFRRRPRRQQQQQQQHREDAVGSQRGAEEEEMAMVEEKTRGRRERGYYVVASGRAAEGA